MGRNEHMSYRYLDRYGYLVGLHVGQGRYVGLLGRVTINFFLCAPLIREGKKRTQ